MVGRIKVVGYGLICFLAGAALVLLAGAGGTQTTPSGRYQVCGTNGGAYILDTQTGQLWARPGIVAVGYDLGTPAHPICEMTKP